MVAIINTGRSIRAAFMYNENKVETQAAELILVKNYPMEMADMGPEHRLQMLLKTAAKNENVSRASVHISLNFSPDEQLSVDTLRQIAAEYMARIGFGQQPFLVYEHRDVTHQHLHIVSVKVRPDGSRIDMQNIGKNRSEPTRKALQEKYNLVRAEDHKQDFWQLKPADARIANYGKSETRAAIYSVLNSVLKTYKYASLAELNAVLKLYNVTAEGGSKGSRTYQHQGLLYRLLDNSGMPVGVPIKASLFPEMFPEKPNLRYLQSRFKVNDLLRQPDKQRLKSAIDFALVKGDKTNLEAMISELSKAGIATVLRQNADGLAYGITFVDHRTKAVFNGSDLGKTYSIKGIMDRCGDREILVSQDQKINLLMDKKRADPAEKTQSHQEDIRANRSQLTATTSSMLEDLFRVEYVHNHNPSAWKKKKKRKKRNQSNNL